MFKKAFCFIITLTSISFAQIIGPKISVQPMKYDFGNIVQGEKVSHIFTITNTGGSELDIMNIRTSCGCTAAKPGKNKLAPNESTDLKVEFNSTYKSGKQVKYVDIVSNDPENSQSKQIAQRHEQTSIQIR